MKKKDLLNKIEEKKAEIANLVAENKLDEAEAETAELDSLEAELKDLERKDAIQNRIGAGVKREDKKSMPLVDNKNEKFYNYLRTGVKVDLMSEGSDINGGYTVPEDIQTAINKYKEENFSLRQYVTVQPVKTETGARTFQKRKTNRTGMLTVAEAAKIGAGRDVQFERINYSVSKYAGYYPATQELLDDSDVNIKAVITNWIGGEALDTDNRLVLEILARLDKIAVNGVDDFKKIFNVKIGQALRAGSVIVTNDDGWNYLDTLKDNDGKYLLQPSPKDLTVKKLFGLYEVVVVPNEILESNTTEAGHRKVPFYCGNLKEGIVIFDRQACQIKVTDQGSVSDYNAFEEDGILFKATLREDVVKRDTKAIVACELDILDATVTANEGSLGE